MKIFAGIAVRSGPRFEVEPLSGMPFLGAHSPAEGFETFPLRKRCGPGQKTALRGVFAGLRGRLGSFFPFFEIIIEHGTIRRAQVER
jgi:hypothetical protein